MEREKLEKLRRKEDKAKAEAAKRAAAAARGDKKVNNSILHSRLSVSDEEKKPYNLGGFFFHSAACWSSSAVGLKTSIESFETSPMILFGREFSHFTGDALNVGSILLPTLIMVSVKNVRWILIFVLIIHVRVLHSLLGCLQKGEEAHPS